MARLDWRTGPKPERRLRDNPVRIDRDDIARAARALVAAYGPRAAELMRERMRAVRRRGDAESASLWFAVARAIEEQMSGLGAEDAKTGQAD